MSDEPSISQTAAHVQRRHFIALFGRALGWLSLWPLGIRAQDQTNQVGQVAVLQGSATVTRANAASAIALRVNDLIFMNDALQTAVNSSLGITFDDETTFSLSANTRIVVDDFVYQEGGSGNTALFTVTRGTAAFVASKIASSGDMKIATPIATMGIRGTTGVVDVPETGAPGGGEPRIKLYPDADGHVGRIEVFDRQGARLGILTQGASAFALRPGAGGRLQAVAFQIPPQEAARDRGVLQRLRESHAIGRQQTIQRRQQRGPNQQRPDNLRPRDRLQPPNKPRPNKMRQPNEQRPPGNNPRQPSGSPQQNRNLRGPGGPRPQPRRSNPYGQKDRH